MGYLRDLSDEAVVYAPFSLLDTASDGLLAPSDLTASNCPLIDGFDKAMWILNAGTMASDETLDCAIYWASNSVASDAVNTSSTDAVFVQLTSDHSGNVYILNMDLRSMGMEKGILYPVGAIAGTLIHSIICLLYGGTGVRPVTQQQTVVDAKG